MFKFLKTQAAQREAEAAKNQTEAERYASLRRRAILKDDLRDPEAAELFALHARHGKGEDLAATATAVIAYTTERKRLDREIPEAERAIVAAEKANEDFQEEWRRLQKQVDDHAAKASASQAAIDAAKKKVKHLNADADKCEEIGNRHWQLLDLPDPGAAAAKAEEERQAALSVAHVHHVFAASREHNAPKAEWERYRGRTNCFIIQQMMQDRPHAREQVQGLDFQPTEKQTTEDAAEFAGMLETIELIRSGNPAKQLRYLIDPANRPGCHLDPATTGDLIEDFETRSLQFQNNPAAGAMLDETDFAQHPGQTRRELDALVAKLAAIRDKATKADDGRDWADSRGATDWQGRPLQQLR